MKMKSMLICGLLGLSFAVLGMAPGPKEKSICFENKANLPKMQSFKYYLRFISSSGKHQEVDVGSQKSVDSSQWKGQFVEVSACYWTEDGERCSGKVSVQRDSMKPGNLIIISGNERELSVANIISNRCE